MHCLVVFSVVCAALLIGSDAMDFTTSEVIGNCVNGHCPDSYTCSLGVCHRPMRKRKEGAPAVGPCVNQKCPDNYVCDIPEDRCYPTEVIVVSPPRPSTTTPSPF